MRLYVQRDNERESVCNAVRNVNYLPEFVTSTMYMFVYVVNTKLYHPIIITQIQVKA